MDLSSIRRLLAVVTVAAVGIDASAAPPSPGRLEGFEIRAEADQIAMVPLGEGDLTGAHLRVTLSRGALVEARYHGACGRAVLHGDPPRRVAAFAPAPAAARRAGAEARVLGTSVAGRRDLVHVTERPGFMPDQLGDDGPSRYLPVVPEGDHLDPVGEEAEPGCFGWLELVVDARGLKIGAQVIATIAYYPPGAPLDRRAARVDHVVAAQVTP